MKHTIILACLLTFAGVTANAQMDSAGVERRLERLSTALALSDSQKTAIRGIMLESAVETARARAEGGGNQQDLWGAARERMQASDAKIEAVLTPDQKAKYADIKQQRRGQFRGGRGN